MSPTHALGVTGLVSSVLSAASGWMDEPILLGVAGVVMTFGNVYALVKSS